MINRVIIVGRLTADPQLRMTSMNKKTCRFSLAVNRRGKDNGADFPNCLAWEQAADLIATHCNKGDQIGVEGHIQTGSYVDNATGKKIYTTDIIVDNVTFLNNRPTEATETPQNNVPIADEELPF